MQLSQLLVLVIIAIITAGWGVWLQHTPGRSNKTIPWPQRAPFLGGGQPDTHAWSRFFAGLRIRRLPRE